MPKSSRQPGKAGAVGVRWVQTLLVLLGQGPGLARDLLLSVETAERAGKGKHGDNGVLGGAGGGRAFFVHGAEGSAVSKDMKPSGHNQ